MGTNKKSGKTENGIEEITKKLEQGVQELFQSERYAEYLRFVGSFYDYSINNSILIWMQCPTASLVAGFKAWQEKYHRTVKKGEHGITIICPIPRTVMMKVKREDGTEELQERKYTAFRRGYVFDISQTEGEDVPEICSKLSGSVDDFPSLLEKLKELSPVPVSFEEFDEPANGFYSREEQKIVVKSGLSEEQTVKTLVHEIAHSVLHCEDGEQAEAGRRAREVQAESVAFTVCSALGIDTSDYSFGYIAGWSEGKELKELQDSMDVIRQTAKRFIEALAK